MSLPPIHAAASGSSPTPPFAPPLGAYLPDYAGVSEVHAAYHRQLQKNHFSNHPVPLIDPEFLSRVQHLQRIRHTGFGSIVPVGIGKTMAQLESERHVEEDLPPQAENSVDASRVFDSGMERDLDADVVDVDASDGLEEYHTVLGESSGL